MNSKRILFSSFLLVALSTTLTFAQGAAGRKVPEFTSRQEYVSMDSTMPFDKAIAALSELSKRFSGKIIVDPFGRTAPIGVSVRGLHWRDALDLVATANSLLLTEKADYIEVRGRSGVSEAGQPASLPVSVDTREVLVSTIFFSLDVTKSLSYGIDWSFSFLKGYDTLSGDFSAPGNTPALDIRYGRPYKFGKVSALLQMFSQNGVGEIITAPRIIVRSGEKGQVQVGQDISVTERTFSASGVTTSVRQIPTGSIVTVIPEVIKEGDIEFISIDLAIDRSSALTTGDAPTIDRNSTKTKLLVIDGEEVFISGLYFNQEEVLRTGIPLLKDLPPWFFGLRYIFGSDSRKTSRRELAILLKVDLIPTLKERTARRAKLLQENVLEKMRKKFEDDVDRLKAKKKEDDY